MYSDVFRRRVIAQGEAAGLPRRALDEAVRYFQGRPALETADIAECLRLARQLAPSAPDDAETWPGLVLQGEQLVEALAPQVVSLRKQMFGAARAPFRSLAAAAAWVERNDWHRTVDALPARARQEYHAARQEGHRLLWQEGRALMARAAKLLQAGVRGASTETTFLAYACPGTRWVHRVAADRPSPLYPLAAAVARWAEYSGFAEAALTAWVLVGTRPRLPVVRVSRSPRWAAGLPPTRVVTLSFFGPGVTPATWRRLYETVREALGEIPYGKPVTEKHVQLVQLVQQLGGVPQGGARGGVVAFWERVRRQYRRRDGTPYRSWRGPMMLYRQLVQKQAAQASRVETDARASRRRGQAGQ